MVLIGGDVVALVGAREEIVEGAVVGQVPGAGDLELVQGDVVTIEVDGGDGGWDWRSR